MICLIDGGVMVDVGTLLPSVFGVAITVLRPEA